MVRPYRTLVWGVNQKERNQQKRQIDFLLVGGDRVRGAKDHNVRRKVWLGARCFRNQNWVENRLLG